MLDSGAAVQEAIVETDLLLELARFVERIAAIARTGLAFKPDGYDSERYEELLKEAARVHAALAQADADAAEAMRLRWRESVVSGYDGYVTTAVGVGAIVFNDRDEILMMKRPSGRWWYPTGFCDVGISPAENVAKEVREEIGLIVRPARLMGIVDSLKVPAPSRHIYSLLFDCAIEGGEIAPNPLEALEAGFFPLEALPEPLHGLDRKWIRLARDFHFEGRAEAFFDPL
jgi:ADP-ribose pyrophosphatase YjhB (NUDIX family)